jgi:hypothetical protein
LTLGITLICGVFVGRIISECLLDESWTRLALVVPIPLLMLVSLFFFQVIFTNLFQMMGPIGSINANTRFYSAQKPCLKRAQLDGFEPPKVTIQMPVYKEGMDSVIIPTIRSLQAAISYYESHGGSANIFVNDDGLRAGIPEEEVRQRREFYHDNNIGWVARPKHNGDEGYVRKGKFKKASNMNFALNVSQKVEEYLQEMVDAKIGADGHGMIDENEEEEMYQIALARVLQENPLAMAEGDIRVGEVILIVDSDTRVVSVIRIFSSQFANSECSLSTASCMVLRRCSCLPRLPSSSIPPVSCRSPATTSRTALPISLIWSTPRFASPSALARSLPLLVTTPSSGGKVCLISRSLRNHAAN